MYYFQGSNSCYYSSILLTLLSSQFTNNTNVFCLMIDDDHRVVLKSISDGVNCEHDYVNASYIDVRDTIDLLCVTSIT